MRVYGQLKLTVLNKLRKVSGGKELGDLVEFALEVGEDATYPPIPPDLQ